MRYRVGDAAGGVYFFTVNLADRTLAPARESDA